MLDFILRFPAKSGKVHIKRRLKEMHIEQSTSGVKMGRFHLIAVR